MIEKYSDYLIFVDESGDHGLSNINNSYPIFVLAFIIISKNNYYEHLVPRFCALKSEFWGHENIILHSADIRKARGEFGFLNNEPLREIFLGHLTEIVDHADFTVVSLAIIKDQLIKKYSKPFNPYNIALRLCLEKLSAFLEQKNQKNKKCHIFIESRGKKEDRALAEEFDVIINKKNDWGRAPRFSFCDMQFQLRYLPKISNCAGLQLADLVAYPIGRHVLNGNQENKAFEVVKKKIWGQIWKFPNL